MAPNRQRGLLRIAGELETRGRIGPGLGGVPSSGAAQAARETEAALGKIRGDLEGFGGYVGRIADRAAAIEGQDEGRLAGMDPEFRPRNDGTIRGEAYDKAGLQVYESQVRLAIDEDIEKGGDLDKKMGAWLSKVPKELHPDVNHMFQRGKLVASRKAAREHQARVVAETSAAMQAELDRSLKGLHQRAYALGLDAEADGVLATDVGLIENLLRRKGPDGKPIVSPVQVQKIVGQAKEAVTDARLLGAFERLPSLEAKEKMIADLEADFAGSKGLAKVYDLPGFQRITRQLEGSLRTARVEQRQQSAAVIEQIKGIGKQAEKGYLPTEAQLAGLKAQAATSPDPLVAQEVARVVDVSTFLSSARKGRPEQLETFISQERERMRREGPDAHSVARVEMAEKLAKEMRTAIKTDPLGWADRVGLTAVKPLDFSGPDELGDSIAGRVVQAEAVAAHLGTEPQYLRPDDKRKLGTMGAQGGAQTAAMAAVISKGGKDRARKILGELFEEAPTTAIVGGHVTQIGMTPVAQDAADGLALQKVDGFKSVGAPAREVRGLAVAEHKGALNGLPETEQALISAANAAYEVRARRRGLSAFNAGLWRQTFREMVGERNVGGVTYGGIVPTRRGTLWGGDSQVIVPPMIRRDAFTRVIGAIQVGDFGEDPPRYGDGTVVQQQDLARARLVQSGDGKYRLNIGAPDAPRYLVDGDKQPFEIDIEKLEPVLRERVPDAWLGNEGKRPPPPGMMKLGGPGVTGDGRAMAPPAVQKILFAGRRAEGGDATALGSAVEMAEKGVAAEEIRSKTGWFQDAVSKRWKFEISDEDARLTEAGEQAFWSVVEGEPRATVRLGELLQHPQLFKNYPGLARVPVTFAEPKDGDAMGRAEIEPGGQRIVVYTHADHEDEGVLLKTVVHEVQHLITGLEREFSGLHPRVEVDAYDAERRLGMSDAERRSVPPAAMRRGASNDGVMTKAQGEALWRSQLMPVFAKVQGGDAAYARALAKYLTETMGIPTTPAEAEQLEPGNIAGYINGKRRR